jgi:hypothetical protein
MLSIAFAERVERVEFDHPVFSEVDQTVSTYAGSRILWEDAT